MSPDILIAFVVFIATTLAEPALYGEVVENRTEFPYVVKISSFNAASNAKEVIETTCGGVIVNKFVVLTVAHCITETGQKVVSMYVVAGRTDFTDNSKFNGQRRNVKAYKVHKDYKKTDYHLFKRSMNYPNDIALLWLVGGFQINPFTKPAILPTIATDIHNAIGISVGWGVQECGYKSKILKKVQLKVLNTDVCIQKYIQFLPDKAFCVMSVDSKSIVSVGDSGGPFIYNKEVLGLLSSGETIQIRRNDGKSKDICNAKAPVAFTDVFAHNDWINLSLEEGAPTTLCSSFNKFVKKCALIGQKVRAG